MRRREFIIGIGVAVAWPLLARAQQPNMQVIGFLSASVRAACLRGLNETGFVENGNVALASQPDTRALRLQAQAS